MRRGYDLNLIICIADFSLIEFLLELRIKKFNFKYYNTVNKKLLMLQQYSKIF